MTINELLFLENYLEKESIFFCGKKKEISFPVEGYDINFSIENNSYWFKHRNNVIINLVKKYANDKIFFDVGGGNGFVSKGLQENGINTCLIEPGIQGCLNAKKRGLENIVCSDLESIRLKENVDFSIGLFDVIEHIENDVDYLNYINSIMGRGGYLFITVPAYNILWSKEDSNGGHFRRYSLQGLIQKLNEAGFESIFSTYIFSFLVLPIFIFRTLPSLFWNKKNGIEKTKKEHIANEKRVTGKLLSKFMSFELNQVEKNHKFLFGSSCLIVAKRM